MPVVELGRLCLSTAVRPLHASVVGASAICPDGAIRCRRRGVDKALLPLLEGRVNGRLNVVVARARLCIFKIQSFGNLLCHIVSGV